MESVEKKPEAKPVLERIYGKKFGSFYEAQAARATVVLNEKDKKADRSVVKKKIFARRDGSFDLVLYGIAGEKVEKKAESKTEAPVKPKEHGLRAKERRKKDRKQQ